ncbi:MAG: chaperone modulator CbpM [Alcanivoracaceae bacterium]|nr:chaperone modulator CbpM [Alcanivoracaceae bacterium]
MDVTVCTAELCQRVSITEQELVEIVSHGIVRPQDVQADEWQFDEVLVVQVARAVRLRRDLEIDWGGVALALELLEEVHGLREENAALRRRLARLAE